MVSLPLQRLHLKSSECSRPSPGRDASPQPSILPQQSCTQGAVGGTVYVDR